MRVFGCYLQNAWGGGMIIACGNTREEAFNAFIEDHYYDCYKDWNNKDKLTGTSRDYPFDKWFEMPELTANCDKPEVLYEQSHKE